MKTQYLLIKHKMKTAAFAASNRNKISTAKIDLTIPDFSGMAGNWRFITKMIRYKYNIFTLK